VDERCRERGRRCFLKEHAPGRIAGHGGFHQLQLFHPGEYRIQAVAGILKTGEELIGDDSTWSNPITSLENLRGFRFQPVDLLRSLIEDDRFGLDGFNQQVDRALRHSLVHIF
jgi:hypothetical protein